MSNDTIKDIEFQAQRYVTLNEEKKDIEEKLSQIKTILGRKLSEAGENQVLVYFDDERSIKVSSGIRSTTKLDKEKMAEDLDVAKAALTTKFLIDLVENRRLSKTSYENYEFQDNNELVSVRLVNAE